MDLKKQVPRESVENYFVSHVRDYQDTIPRYKVVSDWFGNQYYVENDIDQDTVHKEVLQSIDWNQFATSIGRKLFRDYNIELNHAGTELQVRSVMDDIDQIFELNEEADDVEIIGLQLTEDLQEVALKLRVIKKQNKEHHDTSHRIVASADSNESVKEKHTRVKKSKTKKHRHSLSKNVQKSTDNIESAPKSVIAEKSDEPKSYKIEVAFDTTNDTDNKSAISSNQSSRRSSQSSAISVALEEVDDEEVKRWKASLSQSPSGHSILEDK